MPRVEGAELASCESVAVGGGVKFIKREHLPGIGDRKGTNTRVVTATRPFIKSW